MARRRTQREREIDDEIEHLERIRDAAEAAESFTAAVQAEKQVQALRRERHRLQSVRLADGERDPLKRLRRLRRVAQDDGSWVAASTMTKTEAELEARLREAEADKAREELTELSEDELVDEIIGAIPALGRGMVERVLEEAARALGLDPDELLGEFDGDPVEA